MLISSLLVIRRVVIGSHDESGWKREPSTDFERSSFASWERRVGLSQFHSRNLSTYNPSYRITVYTLTPRPLVEISTTHLHTSPGSHSTAPFASQTRSKMERVSAWREGLAEGPGQYRDQLPPVVKRPSVVLDLTSESSNAGGSPDSVRIVEQQPKPPKPQQQLKQSSIQSMFMPRSSQPKQQPLRPVENNHSFASSSAAWQTGDSKRLQGMPRIPKQQPRYELDDSAPPSISNSASSFAPSEKASPKFGFASSGAAFRTSSSSSTGAIVAGPSLTTKQRITAALQEETRAKGVPFAVPANPPYKRPIPRTSSSLRLCPRLAANATNGRTRSGAETPSVRRSSRRGEPPSDGLRGWSGWRRPRGCAQGAYWRYGRPRSSQRRRQRGSLIPRAGILSIAADSSSHSSRFQALFSALSYLTNRADCTGSCPARLGRSAAASSPTTWDSERLFRCSHSSWPIHR